MQDPRFAPPDVGALDDLADRALAALEGDGPDSPAVLRMLLRRYATSGRADLEAALGPALAAVTAPREWPADESVLTEWLWLFVDAATLSGDDRLRDTAVDLSGRIRRGWPTTDAPVRTAMRAIEACLRASDMVADEADARQVVAAAIDELERIVGLVYRPGGGMSHRVGASAVPGEPADQLGAASALLAAHDRTGRLPYSMLAEELMLNLAPDTLALEPALVRCRAVGVLSRLTALHRDADYREAAVIATGADYEGLADVLLRELSAGQREHNSTTAAEFGLALADRLGL